MASDVPRWRRHAVAQALWARSQRRPRFAGLREVASHPLWLLYFVYSPSGQLSAAHRFTLGRLNDLGLPLFIIHAGDRGTSEQLLHYADALYWKETAGYDFSAYTLGLEVLAERSPGADVLVLNDSVFGPFTDLRAVLSASRWQLTGFTASGRVENHVQSYAFFLKDVSRHRLWRLRPVFFPAVVLPDRDDVIFCQETRLARVASRSMSVGALWFCPTGDATQLAPFELLREGFPFIKRSLLTERSSFADKDAMAAHVEQAMRSP